MVVAGHLILLQARCLLFVDAIRVVFTGACLTRLVNHELAAALGMETKSLTVHVGRGLELGSCSCARDQTLMVLMVAN